MLGFHVIGEREGCDVGMPLVGVSVVEYDGRIDMLASLLGISLTEKVGIVLGRSDEDTAEGTRESA